jgi:hypothetical protein
MNQDYTPGEGCQCHAHSESECGCGADWTPREVYELRDKAERYRLEANSLMMQRDRLLVEREQWRLSSVCRIMKRDLEKARIENDWLGERLDKMEMERDGARRSRAKIIEKYEYAVREMHKSTKQRDRLAEELKEAQNAIEMMLRDSSCRRIPAYTEEQLAAVKGGSHDH